MRVEGQCGNGGPWGGSSVPLPTGDRSTGLRAIEAVERAHAQRQPVIQLDNDDPVARIADPDVRYMVTAYLAGASMFEIARRVHCTQATVRRRLIENGVHIRPRVVVTGEVTRDQLTPRRTTP